jgi:hypothetical protein
MRAGWSSKNNQLGTGEALPNLKIIGFAIKAIVYKTNKIVCVTKDILSIAKTIF